MRRKAAYGIPVILGFLFCLWYIFQASDNVAYSDYIRLINSYLPDVANPDKFFVPDILTRVPVTYLGRIINVRLFGYNTYFDMILGVISLAAGGAALAYYAAGERRVGYAWFLLIQFVYFSLNKWEMMTNGTGWVCFLSISGFIFHFAVLDRVVSEDGAGKKEKLCLFALPPVLTLLVAGPYCGGYSVIALLACGALLVSGYRREKKINRVWLGVAAAVLIPLLLYLWSNSNAVYEHRGAVSNVSILQEFVGDPVFFVRFILKAFASAAVGVAQLQQLEQESGGPFLLYILGAAVIVLYLLALYLNIRYRLWEKTVFPLLMILSGGFNHLLILAARWIFLNDEYGMSSRYEIQYQMGMIGILLTFSIVWGLKERKLSVPGRILVICFSALVLWGNAWTTSAEIRTAPFRKSYLQTSRELGLHYRTAGDEELEMYLHSDADDIRSAMQILEENNLNIFRK